jgi:hypothetical protein
MALKPCKECKKEVSVSAKVCPHCGVKDPGITTKELVIGIALLGFFVWVIGAWVLDSDTEQSADTATVSIAAAWHDGGTLANASALEWQRASYKNKLASSADIWAALWNRSKQTLSEDVRDSIHSMEDLRPWAEALVNELDAAFEPDADPAENEKMFTNQEVSSTAALIMVANGWVEL